ncbi:MAG: molybdopterin-dependent oxidoreductase [Granulosicoccus sp.]|nr:molybdopterin-dependent oxidoreductase [Granulosicoccus sp.]
MTGSQTFKTMCPMNCHPTLCGMDVRVKDEKLISIVGDKDNPDSRGILCMRGSAAHEIVGNPQRLVKPMIRANAETDCWEETDWKTALDFIAEKMRAVGREAVGFWQGHGNWNNDYAFGLKRGQMERFGNLYGCQYWNPAMICWGLGGFGFGLTGAIETSTKEDMSANSNLIIMWGANSVSQSNTMKHVEAAKRRGVHLVVIDVRQTEVTGLADEVLLIKPGTDVDLALAMMHVIIAEQLWDKEFVTQNTVGFDALEEHVRSMTPDWAQTKTGIAANRIVKLARLYAEAGAAMIVAGGSSLHKGSNNWQAARAIACLPGLTGNYGKPGGGIGPRHGGRSHGVGFNDLSQPEKRLPGNYLPNQMETIVEAMETGSVKIFFTLGSNFLSSFPDTNRVRAAMRKTDLVVAYDIFSNQTIRETANVYLPSTIWLEELGGKSTNTHLYLCDQALPAAGEARPVYELYRELAKRLGVDDVYPWKDQEEAMNAALDHPATGHATVESMRENGGKVALNISHVAYPTLDFTTPSGKIEFVSEQALNLGLPALPMPSKQHQPEGSLILTHGRTFGHFHSFYDHGRALPTLARREPQPQLWISTEDAQQRNIENGDAIELTNHRGAFNAIAKVTPRIQTGVVWIRDGWPGLNELTEGSAVLPEAALSTFPFSVGQAEFSASVFVGTT